MLIMSQAPVLLSHTVGNSSKEDKVPALTYYSNGKNDLKNKQTRAYTTMPGSGGKQQDTDEE